MKEQPPKRPKNQATLTADKLFMRAYNAAQLTATARKHLLEDQADIISARGDGQGSGGISDPTPHLAHLLAPFAVKERNITSALVGIDRAYDHLEQVIASCISDKAPANQEPRCPGWNDELRARLGGCGAHLESYRLANGKHQYRASMLCTSCRKASERAEREAA